MKQKKKNRKERQTERKKREKRNMEATQQQAQLVHLSPLGLTHAPVNSQLFPSSKEGGVGGLDGYSSGECHPTV